MSEYSANINTAIYKYSEPIYVTEVTGQTQSFIPLRLNLDESNFNFDLAREDGTDFRLAEGSNGTGVLKMWIAYWNSTTRKATVWFKLPELLASETRTLYAFWGFEYDSGISDFETMLGNPGTPIFLFGDDFDSSLDTLNNLCIGDTGTAFADSYLNASYTPSKAFDGDSGTRWNSADAGVGVPCYIGYGFYTPTIIDRVSIEFNNTSYWVDLVIEASNSQSGPYTVLYTFASTPATGSYSTHDFTNNTAYTFYRLYGTRTTDIHQGVREFEMYYRSAVKWSSTFGSYTVSDSVINLGTDAWIRCEVAAPLTGVRSWIVEEGIVGIGSPSSTTAAAHRYRFYGGENALGIDYFWEGDTDRKHDVLYADTYSTYNGVERGLEIGSYSQNYFGYYEPTDNVYQGMANRESYADYGDSWERKVHRNTELTNFRIYGEDTSAANGVAIDWVIVREYSPETEPTLNLSSLWIDYENIGHQLLDNNEYTSDITNVDYYHSSTMGGDPYRMSDDITNSPANIFISDDETTEGSIVIDFGRFKDSVTDNNYIHYSSEDTIEFYNASKLSDLDTDVHDRNYWATTTTSGWAAIIFPEAKNLVSLSLRAVPGESNRMPEQFDFYGSQSDPRFSGWDDKVLIYSGTARDTEEEQTFYFSTGLTFYKYYILEVINTHGGNVAIQEWGMYAQNNALGKKSISQLRLYPVIFGNGEYYFPKQIELLASNDGYNWTTLLHTTNTPTPFVDYTYGRWSRYSFDNLDSYYLYKLTCYDNWRAGEDTIKIAEWEMVERVEEVDNYRILSGSSDDMNNIWADPTTNINNGTLYVTNDTFNTIEYSKLIDSVPIERRVVDGYWGEGPLTDDLSVGGTASDSLGPYNSDPQYAASSAFDGSLSTYYHSVLYSSYPIWIQYEFTLPVRIISISMYPRSDFTSRMPGDFIIKGSNTGAFAGEEVDITSVSGATYSNGSWTEFQFTNSSMYIFYRLHITNKAVGSGSGNYMNIFEIEMKGYPQVWIPPVTVGGSADDFNVKL